MNSWNMVDNWHEQDAILIVLGESVGTRRAFIKHCRTFIRRSQLHSVKKQLRMSAFGAWLLNRGIFVGSFWNNFILDPSRTRLRSRLGDNFRNIKIRKVALEGTASTLHVFSTWRIHHSATSRAKGPATVDGHNNVLIWKECKTIAIMGIILIEHSSMPRVYQAKIIYMFYLKLK